MPKLSDTKITANVVNSARPGDRERFIWDKELKGFGLRIKPSGALSYVIQYRNAENRQRRYTLGSVKKLKPLEARKIAQKRFGEIADGGDPAADRKAARHTAAPTMMEFGEQYLSDYAEVHKKPASVAEDRRNLANHIYPAMGKKRVADITQVDVERLQKKLVSAGKPIAANRVLALLSKLMNRAEELKYRPEHTNPCRHVKRLKETPKERYLDAAETAALARSMADAHLTGSERPEAILAIRLLIYTGARKSEILNLRWGEVHLESGELRLPDSKTRAKVIYLSGPAIRALQELEVGEPDDRVIKATRRGRGPNPKPNIDKAWRRIRAAAGLADVRLHDLRHSFASLAIAGGASLPMIGALLGHADVSTTQRYAHLADNAKRTVAGNVGEAIEALMADPKAV